MHPVAVRAELVVAEDPLVVVLLQVDGPAHAAAERGRTLALWKGTDRTVINPVNTKMFPTKASLTDVMVCWIKCKETDLEVRDFLAATAKDIQHMICVTVVGQCLYMCVQVFNPVLLLSLFFRTF